MKFNDYDPVVVTQVPPIAAPYVRAGDPGIIQPIEHPEHKRHADDLGLVKVRINNFTFWWAVRSLAHGPKLTIVDEAYIAASKPSRYSKRAFSFGYDPYNTVHVHSFYIRMRLAEAS